LNNTKKNGLKKIIYILFALLLFAIPSSFAQFTDCCTNCPLTLPDGDSDTLLLNILGIQNDDLSNPSQGVCGVRLTFNHQWIGDLTLTLISPSGQEVQLIGPPGLYGPSDNATYDITFIPCSETPQSVYPDQWDSENMTGAGVDFVGSFWPSGNPNTGGASFSCLEQFDMGAVNGTWKIFIDDRFALDAGIFVGYDIVFCDPAGVSDCNSNPCGVFAFLEGPESVCEGQEDDLTLDASASTGDTYIWDAEDGGTFDGTPSGSVVNILTAGTYNLTVTQSGSDVNECQETITFVVDPFIPSPEVSIVPSGPLNCENAQITLESESNIPNNQSVNIWVKDGDTNNGQAIDDLVVTEIGLYELTVIDFNTGCFTTVEYAVTDESEYPTALAEADGDFSCVDQIVELTGSSNENGFDYSWDGPVGFNSTDEVIEVMAPGIYNLTVTDPDSGCSETTMVEVVADTLSPSFTVDVAGELDCSNLMTSLTYNSNESFISFEWTGPNNYSNETDDAPLVEIGGTYTLIATSANGCTAANTVEVIQSADVPNINTTAAEPILSCNELTFPLSGSSTTAGVTYEWTGPNNFASSEADAGDVSDFGTYTLTVFSPNGCSVSDDVVIIADTTSPIVTLDPPAVLGCTNNTTTLTSSTTDMGLTYAWSGPSSQSFSDEAPLIEGPGTYTLLVTGENGCTNNYTIEVESDDELPLADVEIDPADMLSCNETEVTVINNDVDADNSYSWTGSNGFTSTESTPTFIQGGTYTLIVTGPNGCTADASVEVMTDTISPSISFTTSELTCNDNMVTIGVSSTENIVNYAWTGVSGYTSAEQNPSDISEGGEYTAIITAENGCTNSVSFTVDQSVDFPDGEIINTQGNTLDCSLTSINLEANSSTNGATFMWTAPAGTETSGAQVEADAVGEYILVITSPNGCTAVEEITIDEDLTGPEITANPNVDLECDGDVPLSVESNENIAAYLWSGPNAFSSTNTNPMVGVDGTYSVIITGDNGCETVSSVEVINMQVPPSIFVDDTQTLVCGQDQIPVSGGSNDANVAFSWTTTGGSIVDGNNTSTINVNAQGTYILTVINTDTGCEAMREVEVDQDNNTPIAEIMALESSTINCNFSTITLDANSSDAGTGFSFVWGSDGGTDISSETNLETTITEAGTYFITVTNDGNQCTSIGRVDIDIDTEEPLIQLSAIGELNCITTLLDINNDMANNSALNLNYEWETTQGGNITSANNNGELQLDMAGTYNLVLTNTDNGCESTETFIVEEDIELPVISAGDNATLDCGVTSLTLEGSISSGETDVDIVWSSANSTILSGANTLNPEVGSAGTYDLLITNNQNGCTQESAVVIEPNMDLPVVEIATANDFNCATSSLLLDASGSTNGQDITYTWTSNTGADIFGDDTSTPEVFEAGEYTLTILNTANNCESSNSITIEADTISPLVTVNNADQLSCTIEEVSLGVNSDITGLDLQWNALSGNIVSGGTTSTPLVDQAGEYELVVTSQANECTAIASVEVTLDENTPTVSIELPEQLTCNLEQLELNATSSSQGNNISLNWEGQGVNFVSGEDGLNPIINMPGIYTLTITDDANGCEVSQSVEVFENKAVPEVIIDEPATINCIEQSYIVQALNQGASDYIYLWETLDGNIVNGASTLSPEIDEDGRYILTITDTQNGCMTIEDIFVVKDIEQPAIIVDSNYDLTCPEPSATVDATGTTSGQNISYSWTDENGSEVFSTLNAEFTTAGMFTLTVENLENGCSNSEIIAVQDLRELPNVEIPTPETITCINNTIELVGQDQNGQNLEYTWSDANGNTINSAVTASTVDVDQAGEYTLFVIDPSNGCEETYTVIVEADQTIPELMVEPENDGMITCDESSLTLNGSVAGLNENEVTISWTTNGGNFIIGENTLTPLINAAGIYTLNVTDNLNGCSNAIEVSIEADAAIPLASLNEPEVLNCNNSTAILSVDEGVGNIDYAWTLDGNSLPNTNTNEIVVDAPGTYMVEITNLDNGCNSADVAEVIQNIDSPSIDAGTNFELQCNVLEFQIEGSSDNNPNYIIEWDAGNGNIVSGESTLSPLVNQPGLYTLTVSNTQNGCISTDDITITQNENVPTEIIADAQNPLCAGDLGALSIQQIVGGEGPYTYSIDGGSAYTSTDLFEDLTSGTYLLSVLDNNGCQVTQEVSIMPAQAISVDLPTEIELLLGDSATLSLNLANIDPTDIESIQWTPSTGLSCDDCLTPTTTSSFDIVYNVEVFLGSGCSASDDIQLRVDRNFDIYIPNAFSPFNSDGINDEFYLFAKDNAVTNISKFAIYDRWGTQLFQRENIQANDSSVAWKGMYRKEELHPDVYIYVIEVEYRDGFKEVLKGDITLMK